MPVGVVSSLIYGLYGPIDKTVNAKQLFGSFHDFIYFIYDYTSVVCLFVKHQPKR